MPILDAIIEPCVCPVVGASPIVGEAVVYLLDAVSILEVHRCTVTADELAVLADRLENLGHHMAENFRTIHARITGRAS